jgi:CubicO group peptidase (beta-lactamase class C family)
VSKKYIQNKRKYIYPFYNQILGNERFNGMFLVAKNGKIIFEKVNGYLDYANEKKLKATTPIHLASISKSVTALAIMRLVDKKELTLEDDVRKYLPIFPYKGVTIRMLLTHRSGVPYYGYFADRIWDHSKKMTNQDVLRLLNKLVPPLNFPSGTHFAYCNTNFALLALVIEEVTGMKFPKAMKTLVFNPLKMKHSFILDTPDRINTISPSYNSRFQMQAVDFLDGIYGDKNMYSTARDLLKLDIATYASDFLSEKSRNEIYKGYSYEKPGMRNYGLGMRMVEVPNKKPYFFHTGWWHGNTGCYVTLRGDTVCIIALSNAYTRSVYQVHQLTGMFEGYPFEFKEEE